MKTWMFAGAIVLAAMGPLVDKSEVANAASLESGRLTEVNIAQIRSLLKLTAAQEPLWNRVEGVLLNVAREQSQEETIGLVRRISRRVISIAFDGVVTQRIKNAALPLLASLNDEQKLTVRLLAQRMGIGDMVALAN
jgi:hypothetical protein